MERTELKTNDTRATLLLLSGNAERIQEQLGLLTGINTVHVHKTDESAIVHVRNMLQLVRPDSQQTAVCFGCKDIDVQRYHIALKGYLLLAKATHRLIIDEQGKSIRFNAVGYFFIDIPKLLLELAVGVFVVTTTFLRLARLRSMLVKNATNEKNFATKFIKKI